MAFFMAGIFLGAIPPFFSRWIPLQGLDFFFPDFQ
jgi:hypothetical protein